MSGGLAPRGPRVGRWIPLGLLTPLALGAALSASGQTSESVAREAAGDESTYVETPLFPGVELARGLRLQLRSRFLPDADLDPGRVDRVSPELDARIHVPLGERALGRINGRIGTSRYEFSGGTPFRALLDPLDLYEARLSFDGAYQLNGEDESWLVEGESWSLLGLLSLNSDWEGGRFDAGLGGNLGLGLGYRIPDRFRIALGAVLRSDLDQGGVGVTPYGSFRWSITKSLTLRDRGLGLLLQYRLSRRLELFVSAFRSTDSWRLKNRLGADDLSFRDRQLQAGAGVEWRITKYLRLNVEAGGIADRKLRVHSDDLGTLVSQSAGPTPYLDFRLELRPGKL